MTAVINNFGGFYRTEVYVHETRMSGAKIHNPCVNKSDKQTTVYGRNIYLGFQHLKSLQKKAMKLIVSEKDENCPYLSLENFINRVPIGIEATQTLIY
jgi:error-prone DNA polymerase